ncbi:hypothetical protein SLS64_007160 [Diaporthe eres]
MPPFREPFPDKARPQSFQKPRLPVLGPNGQYRSLFERGWEDQEYPTQFDKTMEDLGRFEDMYWAWHYSEMKKMHKALCEGSVLGTRWNLPADPTERKQAVHNLPLEAFLPKFFPFGDVPMKHVLSRERYAELGLLITSDAHERAVAVLRKTNQRLANIEFSLAQQQFAVEVRRLKTERRLSNEEATLMVAAAVIAQPTTNVDQQTVTRNVNLFTANADAESKFLGYRDQIDRMKKHKVLKFHHSRMHTHSILSHFDSTAFQYYEVLGNTDFAFKRCMLSLELMGPGVEMVRLNCPASNDDVNQRPHVFSVCQLGVWLARKIERGLVHWMTDACCPVCSTLIPARVRPKAHLSPSKSTF